jgi:PAS domain S-box-containing protein
VILLALDLEERITVINQKDCSLLGWQERQLLGRRLIDACLPARIRHALRELFHNVLEGDRSYFDSPVLTTSGEERLIGCRNALVPDRTGRVTATPCSGHNIHERSHPEAKLREYQKAAGGGEERIVVVAKVAEYRAISAVLVRISHRPRRCG